MADNQLFVQSQAFTLSGSGAVLGAVTIVLQSMKDIDGVNLLITNFGSKGWCTLEPDNGTQEEQISFTGITQNVNGTATLTGVKSVAFKSPYTETAGILKTHPGGSKCVVSNTAAFYDSLTSKSNDETIAGIYTFVQSPVVPTGGTGTQAANATDIANAIIGVSGTATNLVAGTTRLSVAAVVPGNPISVGDNDTRVPTQGENDALVGNNGTPATANKYVTQSGLQYGAEVYAADAGANDTYVITLSPAIAAYAIGQTFHFRANTANTGAATLNVNGRGAIAIVKNGNVALNDNDILANQICTVVYDGTNFQLQDRRVMTSAQGATLTGGVASDASALHFHPDTQFAIASEVLKYSADTVRSTSSGSPTYAKMKEFRVNIPGTFRVKFDFRNIIVGSGFARVYKNGVAYGTLQADSIGTFITFSEDLTFAPNDLVQLYGAGTGGGGIEVRNFRLYYDYSTLVPGVVITD